MASVRASVMSLVVLVGGTLIAAAAEDPLARARAEYEEWMEVLAEFTRGVQFDEQDIRDVLDYWPEMNRLSVMTDQEESETASEFASDVREILADSEYRSWARGKGLDPEEWLRKSMRVSSAYMLQQLAAQKEAMAAQQQSYAAMVEESCAQVDEATCAQMRSTLAQSIALSEAMMNAVELLDPPSATEAALLARYGADLEAVMMADDRDDAYDDYEDYEDYEEQEDSDESGR